MTRPRRSEHTREALIQAGIAHLSQHGYHGTGIKQILDEVKVPKGSFYNYFDSKESFVAELIRVYAAGVLNEMEAFLSTSQGKMSPLAQLRAIYTHIFDRYEALECRQSCLIGSIAAEIGASSDVCQKAMNESVKRWNQHIEALIAAAQREGELRTDITASRIAALVWSVWEGSLIRMKLEGHSYTARDTFGLLLDELLRKDTR